MLEKVHPTSQNSQSEINWGLLQNGGEKTLKQREHLGSVYFISPPWNQRRFFQKIDAWKTISPCLWGFVWFHPFLRKERRMKPSFHFPNRILLAFHRFTQGGVHCSHGLPVAYFCAICVCNWEPSWIEKGVSWRIIPLSKWLVTGGAFFATVTHVIPPIYKPFRPFGREKKPT